MKKIIYLVIATTAISCLNSCKKKPDRAPVANVANGITYTVAQLKATATCTSACQKRFMAEAYLFGVVIADELSGNFYKEIYLRDRENTGGIHVAFKASHSNFFIGDSVHLNLKGYDVNINSSTGMLEIDTVDFDKDMVKFGSGPSPKPVQVDLSTNNYANYLCNLVQVNSIGFIPSDTNQIYADPIQQLSINRTLQDCGGKQLIVRTSNYAHFAQQKTPKGYGSIIGIATAYSGVNQLVIRNTSEVNMNGSGCVVYHKKDFNDNSLINGGWTQQSVIDPAVQWVVSSFSGSFFGKISGFYSSANHNAENWLISPSLNLSSSSNPILTFQTAAKFAGHPLEVWVSTNYVSGAPSTGTWTQLTGFNLSPNNPGTYAWTSSGIVFLNAFKTANTHVAFKYVSSTTGATTYEIDDIIIREN
jgi:hypothetical protein